MAASLSRATALPVALEAERFSRHMRAERWCLDNTEDALMRWQSILQKHDEPLRGLRRDLVLAVA